MKLLTRTTPIAKLTWGITSSSAGQLIVGMTEKGEIARIDFLCGKKPNQVVEAWRDGGKVEIKKGAPLGALSGKPIVLVGTLFQQSVWRVIAKIPQGKVISYGDIAKRIGKPKASRAVGAACGANPVPYLVPCHRVVAANGGLGGFSGGLDVKKRLLKAEGVLTA